MHIENGARSTRLRVLPFVRLPCSTFSEIFLSAGASRSLPLHSPSYSPAISFRVVDDTSERACRRYAAACPGSTESTDSTESKRGRNGGARSSSPRTGTRATRSTFNLEHGETTFESGGALARSECESSLGKGGQRYVSRRYSCPPALRRSRFSFVPFIFFFYPSRLSRSIYTPLLDLATRSILFSSGSFHRGLLEQRSFRLVFRPTFLQIYEETRDTRPKLELAKGPFGRSAN